jgi:hypothetical protein
LLCQSSFLYTSFLSASYSQFIFFRSLFDTHFLLLLFPAFLKSFLLTVIHSLLQFSPSPLLYS